MKHHLVILKKPYLDAILDSRKTIESRLTMTRKSPIGQVSAGDKLFLKLTSGPVCATATAAKVKFFENMTAEKIVKIKNQYNYLICGGDDYWQNKISSRYCCLVWLENVKQIEPVSINKKDWRGWVTLTEKKNFGLLEGKKT